jgi:hypothetical protein
MTEVGPDKTAGKDGRGEVLIAVFFQRLRYMTRDAGFTKQPIEGELSHLAVGPEIGAKAFHSTLS